MTSYLTGVPRILAIFALSLATFLMVLDYTIANVSIPYIAGDLGVSYDQGTYVITAFAVGNAIVLPISGWLTARFGSVRILIASILLFVLFSWLCGLSWDFGMLVVCRFLQGFFSGPLVPLSQSLIISTNPPEKKNTVISLWGMIVITAPVIGPLLGGWISFDYSWPWIFYINIPFGLLSALLIWIYLRPFESPLQKKPVDIIGFILLAIAVTSLQILLDKGEQWDWFSSPKILTLAILSGLGFLYLIVWELLHRHPLIELSLFRTKSFAVSVLFIAMMYSMYFGSVVLVPLWLQSNMGYNAIWAGIAVAPIGVVPLLTSTFSGWVVTRFGKLKPLCLSFLLFAISCFYTAYFDTSVDLMHIWISRLLLGCGLAFLMTPLFALSFQDMPNEKLPSAAGIFHFVRAMFGGIGTSVFTTLWVRRSAFHHEREGSNVSCFSENTTSMLEQMKQLGIQGKKSLVVLNNFVNDQAAMLALNDCFYLMGWLFLLLILFLPIGKPIKKPLK